MNVLILPHLKIHNANALSSPFTIGFPAMTAWLGFMRALERKLNQAGLSEL
ncbi:MAG: type I-F CRISPR-associated protein Csy2, partial [Enterovibrio sp.]